MLSLFWSSDSLLNVIIIYSTHFLTYKETRVTLTALKIIFKSHLRSVINDKTNLSPNSAQKLFLISSRFDVTHIKAER